jgi:hypothetical protein
LRVCWGSHVIATQPVHWRAGCCNSLGANHIENTAPISLTACLFNRVYLATGFFLAPQLDALSKYVTIYTSVKTPYVTRCFIFQYIKTSSTFFCMN